jgi:hypothetical protein
MEAFTEQLKVSALKAAIVAQSLATNGFDEMAASDEYVQSEGYNTTNKKRTTSAVLSSANAEQQQQPQQRQRQPQQQLHSDHIRMKNIPQASAILNNPSKSDESTLQHMLSDSEDENDDPILSSLLNEKQNGQNNIHESENNEEIKKVRPNRFMEDLECRMSMPEKEYVLPISSSINNNSTPSNNNNNNHTSLTSWISTTANSIGIPTPSILVTKLPKDNTTKTDSAPLSRNKHRIQQQRENDTSDVELVSSTTMFDKSDMEQLEQLRLLENQSNGFYSTIIQHQSRSINETLSHVQNYRREYFIVITLLLCAIVYLYSKDKLLD